MMAPILIVHGKKDSVVPITHAYNMAQELSRLKKKFALHVFDKEDHNFTYWGLKKAWDITLNFFQKNLL